GPTKILARIERAVRKVRADHLQARWPEVRDVRPEVKLQVLQRGGQAKGQSPKEGLGSSLGRPLFALVVPTVQGPRGLLVPYQDQLDDRLPLVHLRVDRCENHLRGLALVPAVEYGR